MPENNFLLWDEGIDVTVNDVILYSSYEHFDYYKLLLDDGEIQRPKKAFVCLSDLSNLKQQELLFYITQVESSSESQFNISSNQPVTSLLIRYVDALRKNDLSHICKSQGCLEHLELKPLKSYLNFYQALCTTVLEEITTFFYQAHGSKNKRHNFISMPSSPALNDYVKSNLKKPQFPNEINKFIDSYRRLIRVLNSNDYAEKAFFLSTFYFAIAKSYVVNFFSDAALILLHRSFDLFLLSIAIDNNIVRKTDIGFSYYGRYSNEIVNLHSLFRQLVDDGYLSYTEETNNLVSSLNGHRNVSVLTHGIFSYSSEEVFSYINRIEKSIRDIDGNNRWKHQCNKFCFQFKVPFDLSSSSVSELSLLYERVEL